MQVLRKSSRRSASIGPGFTYIGLLLFIAILGVGLAATGVVFHQQAQREQEKELLFVGDQVRRAIALYYERSPGGDKRFPQSFEDLLQDQRYPAVQRYLRRVYVDPMTGSKKWGLVRAPDGGIIGVYSSSEDRPVKVDNFPPGDEDFKGKESYAEWKFVYAVPVAQQATMPQGSPSKPSATPLSTPQTPATPVQAVPAGN
jgi:type II secretory pathway pseudopilin PulG